MSNLVIATEGLYYGYSSSATILLDINLQVRKGDIYGFLGPNGSGKTTTLSLLLGLLKNQKGNIKLFGQDFTSRNRVGILQRTGSLIESPSLYGHLTARENLDVYRRTYGVTAERVKEVLTLVGLRDTGSKVVKRFSLGMRQRLALGLALLPRPELLILDEPTNGLDPSGIIEFREIIRKLNREEGVTILVSSHILGEIEKLVTHVGIIFRGHMRFQGSLHELHHLQHKQSRLILNTSDNSKALQALERLHPLSTDGVISVPFKDLSNIASINRTLLSHDLDVYLLHPQKNDLEQLFINLTTHPA